MVFSTSIFVEYFQLNSAIQLFYFITLSGMKTSSLLANSKEKHMAKIKRTVKFEDEKSPFNFDYTFSFLINITKKVQNFLYDFSLSREANPVTTLAPLSTLFTFTAGSCQAGFTIVDKLFSLPETVFESGKLFSLPKISSNSPQTLSDAAPSLRSSFKSCTVEVADGFALVQEAESHLASMYSAFLHGGTCIPFFFKLCLAASDTAATI